MGKKQIFDATIISNKALSERYSMMSLQLPEATRGMEVHPGQFVEIRVADSASTYLRRPISICDYCSESNRMTLLIRRAGEGTEHLCNLPEGAKVDIVGPLGNGFSIPKAGSTALLAGGGIGVAPLMLLGKRMVAAGVTPCFLLAARTASEILLLEEFKAIGKVVISTDDGTAGEKGYASDNSALQQRYDLVCVCGPKPMMLGIARKATANGSPCEVSLENLMACGLGACLCCVEPTLKGNLRACVEGPVFNTEMLLWELK
jgi:dihydroorotate dehydrogenase electron transfer subunit